MRLNATLMSAECEQPPKTKTMSADVEVTVKRLGKRFGREWVFREVSFHLRKGETLAVTGPNGSGKTTLLRILAGLEQPSEGRVHIPISQWNKEIGFAGPDLSLYAELTPQEHLQMAADLRSVDEKSEELLAWAQLPNKPVSTLSTGMKARLRLLLATQASPKVLLLDEPFLSLDVCGIKLTEEIFSRQKNYGVLIYATNNPSETKYANYEIQLSPSVV